MEDEEDRPNSAGVILVTFEGTCEILRYHDGIGGKRFLCDLSIVARVFVICHLFEELTSLR